MASYERCLFFSFFFLLVTLSFCHARESKFFSKVAKNREETHDSISISPAISPSLAPSPSPEPEVVERGYGLYGRDPYEFTPTTTNPTNTPVFGEEKYVPVEDLPDNKLYGNGNEYQYPPTTINPTKTPTVGEEKFVPTEELSSNEYRYAPTTTNPRKTPIGYHFNVNQDGKDVGRFEGNGNGNGYGNEKQGMSDTRFLENGKYFYDVSNEEGVKGEKFDQISGNNYENEHFNPNNFENENFEEEKHGMGRNGNDGNGYVAEKQGMSDTRYLENGKYYYDLKSEEGGKEDRFGELNENKNEDDHLEDEKHGIDTRFMDNGKYMYGDGNRNGNENGNENEERKSSYGSTKKLANTYDTMEEYDREQGYMDPKDAYVP